ncbi:MAG: hypothetical protein EBS77_10210, partial [Gammaproteobacteria bacterium]|nr:hypothetical protein [Gammaproteobacteria bacterium]
MAIETGDVRMNDLGRIEAGQTTSIGVAAGDMLLTGVHTVSGETGLAVSLGTGVLTATGVTTIRSTSGSVGLTLSEGRFGLSGTSLIEGASIEFVQRSVSTEAGLVADGETTIRASETDAVLDLNDGIRLSGLSVISAAENVSGSIETGGVVVSGETSIAATAGSIDWQMTIGDLSASGTTRIDSGLDTSIAIQTGDVIFNQNTAVTAGRDFALAIETGDVRMNDQGRIIAGADLDITIRDAGNLVMEDEDTLLKADHVTSNIANTIFLDRIEATSRVDLTAVDGQILDNTASEAVDLIVTDVLTMQASSGIGVNWSDNLNIQANEVSALNSDTGSVNIQNRNAFTVGELGIGNAAVADVILTSLGRIFVKNFAPGLTWETPEAGRVSSIKGQTVHMLQNISSPTFETQPGNQSWQDMIMLRGGNARGLTIMKPSERIAQTESLIQPETTQAEAVEAALERQAEQTRTLIQQLIETRPIEVASVLQNQ